MMKINNYSFRQNPVVEVCLGYTAVVGTMVVDTMATTVEHFDVEMEDLKEVLRKESELDQAWKERMSTRVDVLNDAIREDLTNQLVQVNNRVAQLEGLVEHLRLESDEHYAAMELETSARNR